MRVTIHQPNFVPWYPWFLKASQADAIAILSHCQWSKGGYQNRFRLHGDWYTMSVHRGLEPVSQKTYVSPIEDWERIKDQMYEPGYSEILEQFDDCIGPMLARTNVQIIKRIAARLPVMNHGIDIVDDFPTELRGTERLVAICKSMNADTYVSGPSGRAYLDESLFRDCGIDVEYYRPEPHQCVSSLEVIHGTI